SLQLCRARLICLRLLLHLARLAASRTFWTAGSSRPIRIAMMAMTTSSSISVKPWRRGRADIGYMARYSFGRGEKGASPWAEALVFMECVSDYKRFAGPGDVSNFFLFFNAPRRWLNPGPALAGPAPPGCRGRARGR